MLTVGANSYVSVNDADTYVAANYDSLSEIRVKWQALNASMKERYLTRSASQIDNLILVGRKASTSQAMEFPRAIPTIYRMAVDPLKNTVIGNFLVQTDVPQEVKDAQIEQALVLSLYEGSNTSERQKLVQDGVTQYSIGTLSESLTRSGRSKLRSEIAMEMVKPYILGGVRI